MKCWIGDGVEKEGCKMKKFDKEMSLAIKGIAILMVLFHHMFRSNLSVLENYNITYFPFPETNVCNIGTVFKICVGIFCFISGYGMYLGYQKKTTSSARWVLMREVKMLLPFCFAVILCWIANFIMRGNVPDIYFKNNCYEGIGNMLVELFGCATLFGTPTFCTEWWYISAAVVYIFVTPFVVSAKDRLLSLLLIIISVPRVLGIGFLGGTNIYSFLFVYVVGICCAKYDFVNKWINFKSGIYKFILELLLVILGYKLFLKLPITVFWEFHYGVYPVLVILFAAEFIVKIPGLWKILLFFGKYSANMYFIHSIILYKYSEVTDFIYMKSNFLISFAILLGFSVVTSILIDILKKLIKYERLQVGLCKVITSK